MALWKQTSSKKIWALLIVLLLIFLTAGYFLQSKQPEAYLNYVSESPSPTGTKAVYTYLKEEMESVARWTRSPESLDGNKTGQVLLMIEPHFIPDSEQMNAYETFMEEGNTILLLQQNPQGMFSLMTDPVAIDHEEMTLYDQNDTKRQANIIYDHRMQTGERDEILMYDDAGTIAIKRSFGEGQLIAAIFPEWMTNEQILEKDHVPLIMSLLNESNGNTILFDEYIHKGEGGEAALKVYPMWFLLVMFQGAILAALWLWHQGKRFGPIFSPREAVIRFSDEGVQALAAWYMRSRRYHDSLVIQADYVKLLLQERWHIPYKKEWKDLPAQLGNKWGNGMTKSDIESFVWGLADVLNKEKISKQEYLLWSKKIDRLRKVVEEK